MQSNFDLEKYKEEITNKLQICFNPKCSNLRCKNISLIYTNAKVGSTTLWNSLNFYFSDFLTSLRWHDNLPLKSFGIDIKVNQFIEICNINNKNIIVTDIYRPVFDICQSFFFLYFRMFVDENNYNDLNFIINKFNDCFLLLYKECNIDYYKQIYNINTTINEFDFNKKHIFYRNNNIKYIKLRLIDHDEWVQILSQVFNTEFKIIKDNKTEDKQIGEIYKNFKNSYKIPKNFYEIIKNNEQFLFYYTPEEQRNYLKQFEGKILDIEYNALSVEDAKKTIILSEEKEAEIEIKINQENIVTFTNCNCAKCKAINIKKLKKL
jgi:hypothetical protein